MQFNEFDKDYTLDCFVALVITEYSLTSFFGKCPDFSVQETFLIQQLQKFGVTLEEVDNAIANKDFTGQFVHYGSGDRERGFTMEWITERWNEVIKHSEHLSEY